MKERLDRGHGSPYDRGSADVYYGRPYDPHYYVGLTYTSEHVKTFDMTQKELAEYHAGYTETDDRKDWG